MLKKQDLGINPFVANNGSRDQSLTGIGGPRVTLQNFESERLPEPTGGSSDVVHLLKYASLVFGWLPKAYRVLEAKDTDL